MFGKSRFSRLEPRRLRNLMCLFFIAMAVPTAFLVYKSYDQLKWEAFYQHRQLAEELSSRIEQKFSDFVLREESRSFGDYSFVVVEGNSNTNYLERSPLSTFPVATDTPGVIGYFQIDADGRFSTPLMPGSQALSARFGLSSEELDQRLNAQTLVEEILSSNQLVEKRETQDIASELAQPFEDRYDGPIDKILSSTGAQRSEGSQSQPGSVLNQAAFDNLSETKGARQIDKSVFGAKEGVLDRLEELELDSPYKDKVGQRKSSEVSKQQEGVSLDVMKDEKPNARKIGAKKKTIERALLDEQATALSNTNELVTVGDLGSGIKMFENEIDPFEVSLLNSGHFVLYRKVWRGGKRYIQGLLVEQAPFVDGLVSDSFTSSLLADMSTLTVIYQGNALSSFSNRSGYYSRGDDRQLKGTLLYRTRLSEPFNQLENVYTLRRLPAGPGGQVILWAAFVMALVLSVGIFLLYRMSLRNLALVNQQQDFVSAVSHELKTPLTSIRMYGEMLQEGWADEEKKKSYYSYIFDESERLTRLINNVLELARMTRNETRINLQAMTVAELVDIIHSKVDSLTDRSGFQLNLSIDEPAANSQLEIDPDVFAQIIINLVDNALKFSANAEPKSIDISVSKLSDGKLRFSVRDYGPGVAKDQLKKIFELFYRSENELTRATTGTGIGLALVSQLTQRMGGEIDVLNCDPGAEFSLYFLSQN